MPEIYYISFTEGDFLSFGKGRLIQKLENLFIVDNNGESIVANEVFNSKQELIGALWKKFPKIIKKVDEL